MFAKDMQKYSCGIDLGGNPSQRCNSHCFPIWIENLVVRVAYPLHTVSHNELHSTIL